MRNRATTQLYRAPRGAALFANLVLLATVAAFLYLFLERHQAPATDTPEQMRQKTAAAKIFVTQQADAMLAAYKLHTGRYPTTTEGLWALAIKPPRVTGWQGPYLTGPTMPIDPWGQAYQYAFPGPHNGPDKYDVWSPGPDQINGTADDIGNW